MIPGLRAPKPRGIQIRGVPPAGTQPGTGGMASSVRTRLRDGPRGPLRAGSRPEGPHALSSVSWRSDPPACTRHPDARLHVPSCLCRHTSVHSAARRREPPLSPRAPTRTSPSRVAVSRVDAACAAAACRRCTGTGVRRRGANSPRITGWIQPWHLVSSCTTLLGRLHAVSHSRYTGHMFGRPLPASNNQSQQRVTSLGDVVSRQRPPSQIRCIHHEAIGAVNVLAVTCVCVTQCLPCYLGSSLASTVQSEYDTIHSRRRACEEKAGNCAYSWIVYSRPSLFGILYARFASSVFRSVSCCADALPTLSLPCCCCRRRRRCWVAVAALFFSFVLLSTDSARS